LSLQEAVWFRSSSAVGHDRWESRRLRAVEPDINVARPAWRQFGGVISPSACQSGCANDALGSGSVLRWRILAVDRPESRMRKVRGGIFCMLLAVSVDLARCGGAAPLSPMDRRTGRACLSRTMATTPTTPPHQPNAVEKSEGLSDHQRHTEGSFADAMLERNLAALGERNLDIARSIRQAAEARIEWVTAADGSAVPVLDGRALASKHQPKQEATTFADAIDLREKAVIAVLGFGAGYHVRELCQRLRRTGLVVVLEPDLGLLRAVFSRVDFSETWTAANILFFRGDEELGRYAERFAGAEGVLIQGTELVEHPASKVRVAPFAKSFAHGVTETVRAARVTAATGLARSAQTVRAVLANARRYVGGEGLAPIAGLAQGKLGIVVSAGPSLRRNLHLLAAPGVRDRAIIVATQTVLKPLLAEGIRPHFVAALDWHRISQRFYDGLRAKDVEDTTLVLDPQANPIIAQSYPGPVRAIAAPHLDALLGPLARDMGRLPPGATVAHLCYQIARFLGCNPVALIGQDLGFTDGVYYARGTAIDDVWAPELNPFNTIENLEWTRIARHRSHLVKRRDVHDRTIYTDAQMETYLQRFEYFFLQDERRGLRTIDATEGGVRKAGTEVRTLASTLDEFAREIVPPIPQPHATLDQSRLQRAAARIADVEHEVRTIRQAAQRTGAALAQLLGKEPKRERDDALWHTIETERAKVGERLDTLRLLDEFSQLGVLKRAKADRRIEHTRGISAEAKQQLQFERDLANVRWIEEAAGEYLERLADTAKRLASEAADHVLPEDDEAAVAAKSDGALGQALGEGAVATEVKAAFVVPIDPWHGGLGTPRSLAETLAGRPVLQWTLERLGRSREAASIVLLVPEGYDIEALLDRKRIRVPLEIHRTQGSPFGAQRAAVAAARLWSDSSWRGGIAGLTVYDEVLAASATLQAMERFGITAAVLVGPDWPLVAVEGATGCDELIKRHRTRPDLLRIVFNQSPPGLCGVLVERSLMQELARGGRHASIGWLLAYEPSRPQQDPISKDVCVQIDHTVRRSLVRGVFDTPRNMIRMRRAIEPWIGERGASVAEISATAAIELLERQLFDTVPYYTPQHLIVELNTGRQGSGAASPHRMGSVQRTVMTERRFARLIEQLAESRDSVITLGGAGDPLLHPDFARFIRMAKDGGIRGVHVRTELCAPPATIDLLAESGVDAISVELDADNAETYRRMHGVDRYREVLANMERLLGQRRVLSGSGGAAFAVPWVVPRLQRRVENCDDIDTFFDRWQHILGTALIEGAPPFDPSAESPPVALASARAPSRAMWREMLRRMLVLSDGSVPLSELDLRGDRIFGHVDRGALLQLWRDLVTRRKQMRRELGEETQDLRTRTP
jgi:hypothetical protein